MMSFGLPEMELLALFGLIGLASLTTWGCFTLWRRQHLLEEGLLELWQYVASTQCQPMPLPSADPTEDPVRTLPELVAALKALDHTAIEELLHPAFDLPRTPAIDADGAGMGSLQHRLGTPPTHFHHGWEV